MTWNSGTMSRAAAWCAVRFSPRPAAAPAWLASARFMRLASAWRWVIVAPLGLPVVPDV